MLDGMKWLLQLYQGGIQGPPVLNELILEEKPPILDGQQDLEIFPPLGPFNVRIRRFEMIVPKLDDTDKSTVPQTTTTSTADPQRSTASTTHQTSKAHYQPLLVSKATTTGPRQPQVLSPLNGGHSLISTDQQRAPIMHSLNSGLFSTSTDDQQSPVMSLLNSGRVRHPPMGSGVRPCLHRMLVAARHRHPGSSLLLFHRRTPISPQHSQMLLDQQT